MNKNIDNRIQGLRGLSVIAVIIYHAKININNFEFLKGGFLGVDMFFIISGFFIAAILFNKKNKANIKSKILNFLNRRIRRITPALLFITLVSFFIFWKVLIPRQLIEYSESLISSNFYFSNYFFYLAQSSYSNTHALLVPFLHTWSLSLEMQFYLFMVLIFVFLFILRFKKFLSFFIFFLIIFFIISLYIFNLNPNFGFFDFFSRFWEFLFGICLYFIDKKKRFDFIGGNIKSLLIIISFITILFYFFYFDFNQFDSPYIILPFILSVGIVIFLRDTDNPFMTLVDNRISIFLGNISYSLYLWHYPFFAYLRLDWIENLSIITKISSSFFILLISVFSYYFIEKPFRNTKIISNKNFYLLISFLIIVIISLNTHITKNNGFFDKFIVGNSELTNSRQRILLSEKFINNSFNNDINRKVAVIGNAHGKDTYNSFYFNKELYVDYQFIYSKIEIKNFLNKYNKDKIFKDHVDSSQWIILSTRWSIKDLQNLEKILDLFKDKIILFGQSPEFPESILKFKTTYRLSEVTIYKNFLVKNGPDISTEDQSLLEKEYYSNLFFYDTTKKKISENIKIIAKQKNVPYIDKQQFLCDESKKTCEFLTPKSNYEILYDYSHFSVEGAKYLGKKYYTSLKNILYDQN